MPLGANAASRAAGSPKAARELRVYHGSPDAVLLNHVLLELGGQNPAIVEETANLPDAAKKIVCGATACGGQWCTSPGYAAVHESVAETFVAECKKAAVDLYGNAPRNNSDYFRIISSSGVRKLASLIDPSRVVLAASSMHRPATSTRPFSTRFVVRQSHGR